MANPLPASPSRSWALALLLILVGLILLPVCSAEFVRWDDTHNFVQNAQLNPPTAQTVAFYWRRPFKDLYVPVTYTLWAAIAFLARTPTGLSGGMELNSYAFHTLNLLLHLASTAVVWNLLRPRFATLPAAIATLLFALHPVQVESVAWASGTKDVLAGLLGLMAVWQYILFDDARSRSASEPLTGPSPLLRFGLATAVFVLAMLAKPSAVVVPLVAFLAAMALRPSTKTTHPSPSLFRTHAPLLIWIALCLPIAAIAKAVQPAQALAWTPALWQRPIIALDAIAFYLRQLLLPLWNCIDYGRSPQWLFSSSQVFYTWLAPIAVAVAALRLRRQFPVPALALAVFIAALLPVLGLVPFDFQVYSTTADHYLYLAMLGPALLVAAILHRYPRPAPRWAAIFALALLAVASHRLTWTWQTSESLFSHAVRVNPSSLAANVNLGILLADQAEAAARQGDAQLARQLSDRAIERYEAALRTAPADATTHNNLARMYRLQRRWREAAEHFRAALQANPHSPELYTSLGAMLGMLGDLDGAAAAFGEALRIDPQYAPARQNLQRLGEVRRTPATAPDRSSATH